ncbi:hypothetical protein CLV63_14113 [Murinocardiopsis flavida]|uniref:Uncharacterized protein n=1 Tax=Murinocardiopsis flavida TaxID=645275 RepID=A0A2P8CDH8_9ACTN|nr:hypothetical protein [Murinocardiopsis flavida]PSK83047.1 hypothetical protein CLV63_14113 [Murinocardiopsis flavida]
MSTTTETLPLAAAMRAAALPAAAQVRDADLPDSPTVHRAAGRIVLDPATPLAAAGAAARDTAHHLIRADAVDGGPTSELREWRGRMQILVGASMLLGLTAWGLAWFNGYTVLGGWVIAYLVLVAALDVATERRTDRVEQLAADVMAARLLDALGVDGRVLIVAAITEKPDTPLSRIGGRAGARTRLDHLTAAYRA